MMNSLSVTKRTVERIVGVEGGINATGVGAMEEESLGLGEENLSVAGGIGNWSLGLGRAVGGARNTSAFRAMGDRWRAREGVTKSSTSTGDGSLGLGRAVGGIADTSTSTGMGCGPLGFGRVVGGGTNTSTSSGMGDGSLGSGRTMGGAINSAGGMGDWSLDLSRAVGEVFNDLVGGLNVPEEEVELGGISVSSVGGIGVGMGLGGLGGLLWHVREGTTSVGRGEDIMRTRSVDDLYALAKSKQHFAVLLVRKLFSREQLSGRSAMGGKWANCP